MLFATIPYQREFLSRWSIALAFLAGYVLLDWASYLDPFHALNITPWNPAPSLAILYLLLRGAGGFVTLASAMLVADLFVRSQPAGVLAMIVLNLQLSTGYALIAISIRKILGEDRLFDDRNQLTTFVMVVVGATMLNSLAYVSSHMLAGFLSAADWPTALLWHWLGDSVGIIVTMPLFWALRNAESRQAVLGAVGHWETAAYLVAGIFSLWFAFGIGAQSSFHYFYVLFLPVVWASARQGLPGAVVSVLVMQIGMIVSQRIAAADSVDLIEIQLRVLTLALVGFFIGVVVEEYKHAMQRVRGSMQLVAAGQMGVAIAHEINQPLSAVTTYAAACRLLVARGEYDRLDPVTQSLMDECGRLADIVKRIRDLFGSGALQLSEISIDDLIRTTARSFCLAGECKGCVVQVCEPLPGLRIQGDRVQLEILLRNLLRNAVDAIVDSKGPLGEVRISVAAMERDHLVIRIEDNGPGVPGELAERVFEPFFSTKSSGLGVGLAICREIALAHGGSLRNVQCGHGCIELELPVDC